MDHPINEEAYAEWREYRQLECKKKIGPMAEKKQKKMLSAYPPTIQQDIIDQSIMNSWQGLFPPKNTQASTDPGNELAICDGFNTFYAAYPKKAGEDEARKAWQKLNPSPGLLNTIIADIAARIDQGAWCTGPGKAFIPGPAVYLNQARWQDEIIPRPDFKPTVEQSGLNTARMLIEMDRDGEWLQ